MNTPTIYVGLGVVLLMLFLLVLVLLLTRERADSRRAPEAAAALLSTGAFPIHCRHFPQVRQALSAADQQYLEQRASASIRRKARRERRKVAQQFVAGIKEDFLRLDRVGRTVASLSPEVSRKLEFERLRLMLRFWMLYGLVRMQLAMGVSVVTELARLTELVGGLAAQTERAMAALEEASARRLQSGIRA